MQKDKSKSDITSNYRLITCLPLIGKLFLGVIADEVYENLDLEELMVYFILIGQKLQKSS